MIFSATRAPGRGSSKLSGALVRNAAIRHEFLHIVPGAHWHATSASGLTRPSCLLTCSDALEWRTARLAGRGARARRRLRVIVGVLRHPTFPPCACRLSARPAGLFRRPPPPVAGVTRQEKESRHALQHHNPCAPWDCYRPLGSRPSPLLKISVFAPHRRAPLLHKNCASRT